MIECNVNQIRKSFGADLVFENISFSVQTGERIGLIGPNGSGKTTILKILTGQEQQDEGEITFRKGTNVGYLDQIPNFDADVIVEDILREAKQDVIDLKHEIDALTERLQHEQGEKLERSLAIYSNQIHAFEQMDGYLLETTIDKVCIGLNITGDMRKLPFDVLSGGEKTRVMLARILLENPSILLLDEPSNHLDLDSIEWLEDYLKDYRGSVLIVSHDRYFLDHVCQKIVELSMHRAICYHGNYSYYVIERERRFLLELKAYLAQEKQTKRMEEQIKRYRIWGVMRDSEKMFKRAKELERRLDKVERLDQPIKDNPKMTLKNKDIPRSGKRILAANHMSKRFDDVLLFEDAKIELIDQDRLAVLGPNGSGKTTLIRMLLEDFERDEPSFKWGKRLIIGYLPQDIRFADETKTIIDYFMDEHGVGQAVARRELAQARFIQDDVFKRIDTLSGGEKSKLMLCSLTFNQANLMILDEPTNHLDIDSREILEDMLLEYRGTILFISHDRYFIKKIASRIGEIRNHRIRYYEGDFDYYKAIKKREAEPKVGKEEKKPKIRPANKPNRTRDVVKEIEELEIRMDQLERKINDVAYDHDALMELYAEKEKLHKEHSMLFSLLEEA
jgi:ATP-binding cassette, subfamily F, member 3